MNHERITNERGMALLVTLVIVALLVAIVVEFDYGTRAALTSAGTFRDGIQATYLAKSGVRAAQAILKADAKRKEAYDATTELWATPITPYAMGNGFVSGQITDESSKLNLNLLKKDYTKWAPLFRRLFNVLEIEPELVSAIKDWMDEDDFPEGFYGAESDYYGRLIPGYTCKNGPINSVSELRLIRGITGEVYKRLTTGCDGKPCVTAAPTEKVNLNTVSVEVCQALGNVDPESKTTEGEPLDQEVCQRLVEQRPYENFPEVGSVPGWGGVGGSAGYVFKHQTFQLVDLRSSYFSVSAKGEVNETQRVAEALVERKGENTKVLSWRLE
jgi:general secretion pathway protein K